MSTVASEVTPDTRGARRHPGLNPGHPWRMAPHGPWRLLTRKVQNTSQLHEPYFPQCQCSPTCKAYVASAVCARARRGARYSHGPQPPVSSRTMLVLATTYEVRGWRVCAGARSSHGPQAPAAPPSPCPWRACVRGRPRSSGATAALPPPCRRPAAAEQRQRQCSSR